MKVFQLKYILLLLIFITIKNESTGQNKLPEEINYKMGIMAYAFDEINISDGNAALELWMQSTKKRLLRKGVKKVDIVYKSYNNLIKLEDDIISNKIDVFSIKTVDYLKLKYSNNYAPLFAGTRSANSKYEKFILITNKQTGFKSISDIFNEEIASAKSVFEELSVMWAEVAIKEFFVSKLKKRVRFNSLAISESKLLLGVFFGKYKCAVVSLSAFELVCELNPQVKNSTVILAASPNIINSLFARKKDIDQGTVEVLELFATDLKGDIEGQQVLNLFKVDRIEKISFSDIKETKDLINKHKLFFGAK